jgi:hypothetical protein
MPQRRIVTTKDREAFSIVECLYAILDSLCRCTFRRFVNFCSNILISSFGIFFRKITLWALMSTFSSTMLCLVASNKMDLYLEMERQFCQHYHISNQSKLLRFMGFNFIQCIKISPSSLVSFWNATCNFSSSLLLILFMDIGQLLFETLLLKYTNKLCWVEGWICLEAKVDFLNVGLQFLCKFCFWA